MPEFGEMTLKIVVLAVMLFGLLSLFTLVIPGLTVMWLAALLYGLFEGFDWVSGALFAMITLLAIAGSLADNVLMGTGARKMGASWLSVGLALVGGLLAAVFWTPLGGLLVALGVLFLAEYIRRGDWRSALIATRNMALGCGWATAIRILVGFVIIGIWLFWAFIL